MAAHYDELHAFYREVRGEHVRHGYWSRSNETAEQATDALVDLPASRWMVNDFPDAAFDRANAVESLLDGTARNRMLAFTMPRLMIAYRTGSMRYCQMIFQR